MDGYVEVYQGPEYLGKIPAKLFNRLIDKYIENFDDYTEVVDSFNNDRLYVKEVIEKEGVKKELKYFGMEPIKMWDVTWEYIARSNYGRSKPFWRIRLVRRLFGPIV
jgi:hypothetical protein